LRQPAGSPADLWGLGVESSVAGSGRPLRAWGLEVLAPLGPQALTPLSPYAPIAFNGAKRFVRVARLWGASSSAWQEPRKYSGDPARRRDEVAADTVRLRTPRTDLQSDHGHQHRAQDLKDRPEAAPGRLNFHCHTAPQTGRRSRRAPQPPSPQRSTGAARRLPHPPGWVGVITCSRRAWCR
jgi:hypothetical protein